MSVISEPVMQVRAMTARMHPLFAELFIDPPGDQQDSDETRRARARRVRRLQAVSARPGTRVAAGEGVS